jgi:hypothetical protein
VADFSLKFADGSEQYTFSNVESFSDNFADLAPTTTRTLGLSGGFDVYGSEVAPSSVGVVRVSLTVDTARDSMQGTLDTLRKIADRGLEKLYYQPQGSLTERWCYARIQNIQHTHRGDDYLSLVRVQVIFQVPDPFWYEDETTTSQACTGSSTDITVTNNGNATALAKIKISCGAGETAENPRIRRIVDGNTVDEVEYSGTVSATEELIIDAQSKAVTLDGSNAYEGNPADHPDWFRLLPGSNTVRVVFTNGGDAATVYVYHYDTFR